jgi:hypothetical protein
VRKKNSQIDADVRAKFENDLVEDLGWEWMSEVQRNTVLAYVWEERHGDGYQCMHSFASDLDEILSKFRKP